MTREEILKEALRCVTGEREQQYGSPEDSFMAIAELWTVYLEHGCVEDNGAVLLHPEDVAAMMALLKIARISTGQSKADNWVDLAGYAACGGEIQTRGEWGRRKQGHEKVSKYCKNQKSCRKCAVYKKCGGNPPCYKYPDQWGTDELEEMLKLIEEESRNGK